MSHLTAAIAEVGVQEFFNGIVENFVFEDADGGTFGGVGASYDIKLHLENGDIDLTNDNTVKIEELDIVWDRFILHLTADIPEVCTPNGCTTIFGFEVCIPSWCIFSANPEIDIAFDLSTFVKASEISGELEPVVSYFVHPARPPGMNYLDAEDAPDPDDPTNPDKNLANRWQVFLNPVWMDIDLIDFEATVETLLTDLVDLLMDTVFAGIPGWAKDIILGITGPLIDFLGDIFDFFDDFDEWLSDLFNISFGLGDLILNLVADFLAGKTPIVDLEDPLPVLNEEEHPAEGYTLIPVKIPVADLSAVINTNEMVIEATVGASL